MQLIRSEPLFKAAKDELPAQFRPEQPKTPLDQAGAAGVAGAVALGGVVAGMGLASMPEGKEFARTAAAHASKVAKPAAAAAAAGAAAAGAAARAGHRAATRGAASARFGEAAAADPHSPIGKIVNAIHRSAKRKVASGFAQPAAAGARWGLGATKPAGTGFRAILLRGLKKGAPARSWQEDQHPRGDHGKFSSKGEGEHAQRIQSAIDGTTGHKPWDDAVARMASRGRKPWITVHPKTGAVAVSTGQMVRPVAGPRTEPEADSTHQRPAPVVDLGERRTQARMSSLYRTATKTKELPEAYTGSKQPEIPLGSFIHQDLAIHRPKALTPAQHEGVRSGLIAIINAERESTIANGMVPKKRGKQRGNVLIPEGTPRGLVGKAYRHGAYRAAHAFGIGHYSYQMDSELQQQMKPLEHFVRYSERKVKARMLGELKGQWQPYRKEFGIPFKDNKLDPRTGEVRLRVRGLPPIIKAAGVFDDQHADGSFDLPELAKKAAKPTEPTDDQVSLAQTAGGAIGTAAGTYAAVRATKQGIEHVGNTIARGTAAGVRLDARRSAPSSFAHRMSEPVVRDQARIAGHLSGAHFKGFAGAAATLAGAALGNYGGDVIARRIVGAKGKQDDYKPGGLQDLTGLIGGAVIGRKLAHLGKAADSDKGEKRESDTLLQPTQALTGAFTGTLTATAAHHYLHGPIDRLSDKVGAAAGRAFAGSARDAGGAVRGSARLVRAHEYAGIRNGAKMATKHGLGGLAVGAASLAGDILGDKISRVVSGKSGEQDEFRHSSVLGATLGTIGVMAGHHYGGSSAFRANRQNPLHATMRGIAGGTIGGVTGEAVGNVLDEKTGTTDAVAGINRRTMHRFGAR